MAHIKLTLSNAVVFYTPKHSLDDVVFYKMHDEEFTSLKHPDGDIYHVKETPEEIYEMLYGVK